MLHKRRGWDNNRRISWASLTCLCHCGEIEPPVGRDLRSLDTATEVHDIDVGSVLCTACSMTKDCVRWRLGMRVSSSLNFPVLLSALKVLACETDQR